MPYFQTNAAQLGTFGEHRDQAGTAPHCVKLVKLQVTLKVVKLQVTLCSLQMQD